MAQQINILTTAIPTQNTRLGVVNMTIGTLNLKVCAVLVEVVHAEGQAVVLAVILPMEKQIVGMAAAITTKQESICVVALTLGTLNLRRCAVHVEVVANNKSR